MFLKVWQVIVHVQCHQRHRKWPKSHSVALRQNRETIILKKVLFWLENVSLAILPHFPQSTTQENIKTSIIIILIIIITKKNSSSHIIVDFHKRPNDIYFFFRMKRFFFSFSIHGLKGFKQKMPVTLIELTYYTQQFLCGETRN